MYVRSGWQALVSAGSGQAWPLADDYRTARKGGQCSALENIVAKTLAACVGEIGELWRHPAVRALLKTNKLRLEEYAAL